MSEEIADVTRPAGTSQQGKEKPVRAATGTGRRPGGTLRPVQVRSATDLVLERLEALILDGTLRPGDQLPAEPELSEAFKVGRSTVREAKRALIAHGLLEARSKLGTFVVGPPTDPAQLPSIRNLVDNPALSELHETRLIVEMGAIRRAASRATDEDIVALHDNLDQISAEIASGEPDVWVRLVSFHRNLVHAAHNDVLLRLFDVISSLIKTYQIPYYPAVAELESEVHDHRHLVEAIAKRDPDAAEAAMFEHLETSEDLRQGVVRRLQDQS